MTGTAQEFFRVKNNVNGGCFLYLTPADISEAVFPRNHSECRLALLNAFDVLYDDDLESDLDQIDSEERPPYLMKRKGDYLCFYADEHTHYNYAMQWFGMGTMFLGMTLYRFIELFRWKY